MRHFPTSVFAFLVLASSAAWGDIPLYPIPGTPLAFTLQGRVTANPGGSVTFRHSRFGVLYFSLDNVGIYKSQTTKEIADQKLRKAVSKADVDACLAAGSWALHHGLLREFYEAASAAWKIDRTHPTVKRLAALKQKISADVAASAEQEREIQEYVKPGKPMTFVRSKHFLLLHDTPTTKPSGSKWTRSEERLRLLETVYESYLMKFCLQGLELEVPKEHLKVVLFADKVDYLKLGDRSEMELTKAAGFYHMKANTAVFYDQGTNEIFEVMDRLNKELQRGKQQAIKERSEDARDIVRFANTIQLLTRVARENQDIEVVSHEATHHLAANTGLMPVGAPVPLWAAEGLATYFESPKDAAWSGIGAVNRQRLKWYRELALDRVHSDIDFIVSDQIFTLAAADVAVVHAYGQAWALTHFLMERHFDKLVAYYRLIAQKRSKKRLPAKEYLGLFNQVFGKSKVGLDREWRQYMKSLKTDVESVLEENY
ncbi:MAG: DUF1570 domain-containing protein [Pirellulales bacterium]|nr:DUF1570 domain-containing protein [Pirellulales bacterium]